MSEYERRKLGAMLYALVSIQDSLTHNNERKLPVADLVKERNEMMDGIVEHVDKLIAQSQPSL